MNDKKQKLPNWKGWGETKFLPWYEKNQNKGITPPEDRSKDGWDQWGETIYRPWYNNVVQTQDDSGSNPGTPPPPPPGSQP